MELEEQAQVEIKDTHFGKRFKHEIGGPVIFMGLPRLGGWKPFGSLYLSHQAYVEKAEEWLVKNRGAREIAVVNVTTGEWQTVWLKEGEDSTNHMEDNLVREVEGLIEEVEEETLESEGTPKHTVKDVLNRLKEAIN